MDHKLLFTLKQEGSSKLAIIVQPLLSKILKMFYCVVVKVESTAAINIQITLSVSGEKGERFSNDEGTS